MLQGVSEAMAAATSLWADDPSCSVSPTSLSLGSDHTVLSHLALVAFQHYCDRIVVLLARVPRTVLCFH